MTSTINSLLTLLAICWLIISVFHYLIVKNNKKINLQTDENEDFKNQKYVSNANLLLFIIIINNSSSNSRSNSSVTFLAKNIYIKKCLDTGV